MKRSTDELKLIRFFRIFRREGARPLPRFGETERRKTVPYNIIHHKHVIVVGQVAGFNLTSEDLIATLLRPSR